MKQKLEKFYHEHSDAIGFGLIGFGAGMIVTALAWNKDVNSQSISYVKTGTYEDGSPAVQLVKKNGQTRNFVIDPTFTPE